MTSCCINFAIISNGFTSPFGKKEKKNCHLYNTILSLFISRHYKKSLLRSQIYHGYEELSTDINYPIWRRQKLPYMKKTRKKKQVCGAACFMAAEIKFSEDVRLQKPEIPSFHLYMDPLVHPTNCDCFSACPSVWMGFRAFPGERMEGIAWNFACWCILTTFWTD